MTIETLRRLNRVPTCQAGQVMLELALGLSVMLLVLLGILDFAPAVPRGAVEAAYLAELPRRAGRVWAASSRDPGLTDLR